MTHDDDALETLQQAIIRKLTPWLVAGGVAIGGVGGSGVLRVDKFTSKDARILKAEILEHVDQELLEEEKDCRQFRQGIDKRINVIEWQMKTVVNQAEERRLTIRALYEHKHRKDDGSVVAEDRR